MKILCIGDIMLDVVAILDSDINYASDTKAQISTHGGGAAANVASWLAVTGSDTFLIARVGDDSAGKSVLAELDRYGVTHANTVIEGAHTGVVIVLVDKSGERTMFPDSGANSGLGPTDLPDLDDITAIYLSGYCLLNLESRAGVLEIIEIARNRNLKIVFDPASVGVLAHAGADQVRIWLSLMDLLIMNEEEAHFLSGLVDPVQAITNLLELCPTVVIKRGSHGSLAQHRGGEVVHMQAMPAEVVDTTGAGDCFAAGFIPAWLNQRDLTECLSGASDLAAQCVSVIGARPLVATS